MEDYIKRQAKKWKSTQFGHQGFEMEQFMKELDKLLFDIEKADSIIKIDACVAGLLYRIKKLAAKIKDSTHKNIIFEKVNTIVPLVSSNTNTRFNINDSGYSRKAASKIFENIKAICNCLEIPDDISVVYMDTSRDEEYARAFAEGDL